MLDHERGGQALLVSEVCGEEDDAGGASPMDHGVAKKSSLAGTEPVLTSLAKEPDAFKSLS